MTVKRVYVPSWTHNELNDIRIKNGEKTRSRLEMEQEEMSSAMHAMDSVNNTDDAIFLCIRKALPNGDFKYGIMCTNLDSKILEIKLDNFNLQAPIIGSIKNSIGDVLEKVLKNLAFI